MQKKKHRVPATEAKKKTSFWLRSSKSPYVKTNYNKVQLQNKRRGGSSPVIMNISEVNQKLTWYCDYVEEAKSRGKTFVFSQQTSLPHKICEEKQPKFENIVLKNNVSFYSWKIEQRHPKNLLQLRNPGPSSKNERCQIIK